MEFRSESAALAALMLFRASCGVVEFGVELNEHPRECYVAETYVLTPL